ncbi:MAG: hypothetical protein VYE22_01275 [Myxococcota bacterium]|nr:hypothetical protein [Myxococcota bacterium]
MTLTRDEQILLAALARLVMIADRELSDAEARHAADLGRRLELAPSEWEAVWDEATRALPSADATLAAAERVDRVEAREAIYELIYRLAEEATIVDEEWDLLEALDARWR